MNASPSPTVWVLHGDNDFAMHRFVQTLLPVVDPSGVFDMNVTRLDGRLAGEEEIRTAAATLSFFDTANRLVILTNPLARLKDKKSQERFCSLMESLPPTTTLILMVEDEKERGRWREMPDKHWLEAWAQKAQPQACLKRFFQPRPAEMPHLILQQAKELGGEITLPAAEALAAQTGPDPRLTFLEIEKLLTYVNFSRPVDVKDVEAAAAEPLNPVNIFDMIGNLAQGNAPTALRMLHSLLEQEEPLLVFSLIVRQFRLLLLTREILDEGGNDAAVVRDLSQPPYIVTKLVSQARRFDLPRLEKIYRDLYQIDVGVKTGRIDNIKPTLEAFVVELAKSGSYS